VIKKVVLFGSESTGKTTLAQQLAQHYQTVWVPEYARAYLEKKGSICELSDIEPIGYGQLRLEDEKIKQANQVLICDTDARETKVYSYAYFNTCPESLLKEVDNRRYDLYLLLNVDIPWMKDSLRDRPHLRNEMHDLFKSELQKNNLNFIEIRGDFDSRLKQAIQAIDQLLLKK